MGPSRVRVRPPALLTRAVERMSTRKLDGSGSGQGVVLGRGSMLSALFHRGEGWRSLIMVDESRRSSTYGDWGIGGAAHLGSSEGDEYMVSLEIGEGGGCKGSSTSSAPSDSDSDCS